MKPGVAKGIHWRPKQSISQQVRSENITYLLTDRYVLGHVTGLNGFYLSRFKTPFLNLPVLYIPWNNENVCLFTEFSSYFRVNFPLHHRTVNTFWLLFDYWCVNYKRNWNKYNVFLNKAKNAWMYLNMYLYNFTDSRTTVEVIWLQ